MPRQASTRHTICETFQWPFPWQAFGTTISASLAVEKNEKRKKLHPEEEWIQWYPLEIRNFPHWTTPDDVKETICTVGPPSQRVRIMHYDPVPSLSVARAYFRDEGDRDAILKALAGYEFSPGYALMVMALARTACAAPNLSLCSTSAAPMHTGFLQPIHGCR